MLTPDSERVVVKFLVAALGQPREQARAFCHRFPEHSHEALLAISQGWFQKSCLEANRDFMRLMGATQPATVPTQPSNTSVRSSAPTKGPKSSSGKKAKAVWAKGRKSQWTPERRAKLSRKMKKLWKQTHPAATPTETPAVVHDTAPRMSLGGTF